MSKLPQIKFNLGSDDDELNPDSVPTPDPDDEPLINVQMRNLQQEYRDKIGVINKELQDIVTNFKVSEVHVQNA
jgi:hypothetical protein